MSLDASSPTPTDTETSAAAAEPGHERRDDLGAVRRARRRPRGRVWPLRIAVLVAFFGVWEVLTTYLSTRSTTPSPA